MPPCFHPGRQHEALATPLDPVEQRALLDQCTALMRPSWALNMASFTQPQVGWWGGARGAWEPVHAAAQAMLLIRCPRASLCVHGAKFASPGLLFALLSCIG